MSKITAIDNKILFQMRDETVLVEAYGDNCIRVRASKNTILSDEAWTLLPPTEANPSVVPTEDGLYILKNGKLSVKISRIWQSYKLTFFRDGKKILETREEGDALRRYRHTEGNHYTIKTLFEANPGEHIYGLGQEQCSYFDKKGCSSELIHYNTKSAMPVIYSSLGYGFFWNNPGTGRCEFTNNHTLWLADSAYQADYLVFTGDTPADIMHKYCTLTGFSPDMPSWAAGFWQCSFVTKVRMI